MRRKGKVYHGHAMPRLSRRLGRLRHRTFRSRLTPQHVIGHGPTGAFAQARRTCRAELRLGLYGKEYD